MSAHFKTRVVLALVLAISCASSCGEDPSVTPELVAPSTGDAQRGIELVFRIVRDARRPDGTRTLSAVATREGRAVGFDLELGPWHENQPGYVNMPTWDCKAFVRSQGAASDELVRVLDELLATHLQPSRMLDAVEVQGFSPWKDPSQLEEDAAKFLLLFPSGRDFDQGGELRVEVDLEHARLHVREKDAKLRLAVMRTLCATP